MEIAERLRLVLAAHDLNNATFARSLGQKPTTTSNWLTGNSRVGLDAALLIRDRYGLPLDFLYCGGSVDKLPNKIHDAFMSSPLDIHSK